MHEAQIERLTRAAAIMRQRAETAESQARKEHCLREAQRLDETAADLVKADEAAALVEDRVRRGGGVWFPTDGQ